MLLERVLILSALAIGIGLTIVAYRWFVQHVTKRQAAIDWHSRLTLTSDIPALLYLWTRTCRTCHTVQKPAVDKVAAQHPSSLSVVSVNATDHPEITRDLHLVTVPATVVLDARGHIRHINRGLADFATLRRQVADVTAI
mgnify:CR=1 FL=1